MVSYRRPVYVSYNVVVVVFVAIPYCFPVPWHHAPGEHAVVQVEVDTEVGAVYGKLVESLAGSLPCWLMLWGDSFHIRIVSQYI
jgi:hypothetical protein